MQVGSSSLSTMVQQLSPAVAKQPAAPVTPPAAKSEEANESAQERTREAGKGSTIDTFA